MTRLCGGDIDRIEENIFEVGVAIGAQNPHRVLDVARIDRIAALEQFVQLAQQLARKRLLGMTARNFERVAVGANLDAEPSLDRAQMGVMLAQQFGKKAVVVEMEFERIFSSG